jgi:hypothetical protein
MNQHLLEAHEQCASSQSALQSTFEQSICASLFLPEPDGSLDAWLEGTAKHDDSEDSKEAAVLEAASTEAATQETPDTLILKHQGALPLIEANSGQVALPFEDFFQLGYKAMTLEIFSKLRETFGQEECEHCGRLFFYKNDHAIHVRTHIGELSYNSVY